MGSEMCIRDSNNAVSCKKNKKKVSVKEQTVDVEAGHYDFLFNLK